MHSNTTLEWCLTKINSVCKRKCMSEFMCLKVFYVWMCIYVCMLACTCIWVSTHIHTHKDLRKIRSLHTHVQFYILARAHRFTSNLTYIRPNPQNIRLNLRAPEPRKQREQLPPFPLLCVGIQGQKVPFGQAQKCPIKNDKIILKNLKTANS